MAEDAPVKIALLRVTNRDETPAPADRHHLRRVDPRRAARAHPAPGAHRVRPRSRRRSSPGTPSIPSSPAGSRSTRMSEPVTALHRRAAASSWAATARAEAPAALRADGALGGHHRRRHRSLRGAAVRARAGSRARPGRSRSCSAPPTSEAEARQALAALPGRRRRPRRPSARTVARLERAAVGHHGARRRSRRFDAMLNRWTLYQALACRMWAPLGALPEQRRLRLPRPAPGRDGARVRRAGAGAGAHPARGGAPVRRGRRAALVAPAERPRACAPGSPTTSPGCPTWSTTTSAVTGDASVLDEYVPFLTHAAARAATSTRCTTCPQVTDEHGSVYEHCLRALRRACTTGRARPAADRHRRLERRHEPRRRGGQGRERVAGLVPDHHAARVRRARATRGATRPWRRSSGAQADAYAAAVEAHGWDGEWYRRAYFDDGTPLGSPRERRVPDRLDRAELERDLRAPASPDRQTQAMRSLEEHLVREDARLLHAAHAAVRPDRRTIPATSRATCPACGRTARSTPTPRSGRCWPPRCRATRDRAFELYQMINPLTHARTPEEVATYKVEPYVVAADVYTAKGQLGRGGWTWYTGSASWMYRVGLEGILGLHQAGRHALHRAASPGLVAGVQHRVPARRERVRDRGAERRRCDHGRSR